MNQAEKVLKNLGFKFNAVTWDWTWKDVKFSHDFVLGDPQGVLEFLLRHHTEYMETHSGPG